MGPGAKEEAIRLEKQKAEDDRIAREKARLEAERKKKQEEAAIYATLKQAKLEAQMEKERKEKERQMAELLEQEKKRKIQMEKEEKESKSREEDLRKKWQLRAQEIYQRGKQKRERNNKDAETESKQTDEFWKEQQEKSKIADRHRSERAKQARRSLRMSVDYSTLGMPGVVEQAMQQNLHKPKPALPPRPQKTRPDRPRNRRDITEWFLEVEKPKMTGIDPKTNRPAKWFHVASGSLGRGQDQVVDHPLSRAVVPPPSGHKDASLMLLSATREQASVWQGAESEHLNRFWAWS
uniref:Stress response protein nst-1-like n=1 Tax=Saccoglossus kowalevskii TaxID=10224 RepID=A0ABM0MB45_SACKO|nr:PREDICTED: stress response protein nst-1-like [Saccoglossus kowalevskii]